MIFCLEVTILFYIYADHYILYFISGLTKPDEVGEIFALYRLKLLSFNYKAKSKPCFFANYLRFMVKLIDRAIVINVKIHKNERKGFYSSNTEGLIFTGDALDQQFMP